MSTLHRPGVAAGRDAQALHRAATPDYFGWLEHTRTAGGCARPIRLTGAMTAVDRDTGAGPGRAAHRRAARSGALQGVRQSAGCPVPGLLLGLRR